MFYVREIVAGLSSPLVVLSPTRLSRQLLKFAYTELYTYVDIESVARRQDDPQLRARMHRHASDELVHYQRFRDWAHQIEPHARLDHPDSPPHSPLDPATVAWAASQKAAPNRRFPILQDYMTYLAISESRAYLHFFLYRMINRYSPACRKHFPPILRDEGRHVTYSFRHAVRGATQNPWQASVGLLRVVRYILLQDVVEILKLLQSAGSWLVVALLYYGFLTPYALVLRLCGTVRRGRLRTWRRTEAVDHGDLSGEAPR